MTGPAQPSVAQPPLGRCARCWQCADAGPMGAALPGCWPCVQGTRASSPEGCLPLQRRQLPINECLPSRRLCSTHDKAANVILMPARSDPYNPLVNEVRLWASVQNGKPWRQCVPLGSIDRCGQARQGREAPLQQRRGFMARWSPTGNPRPPGGMPASPALGQHPSAPVRTVAWPCALTRHTGAVHADINPCPPPVAPLVQAGQGGLRAARQLRPASHRDQDARGGHGPAACPGRGGGSCRSTASGRPA